MKVLFFIAALLVVPSSKASPEEYDDILTITEDFFTDELIVHTTEYDIVDILFPLNGLNIQPHSKDGHGHLGLNTVLFYVLADEESGSRVYKGLFVRRSGEVTKLLDNGRQTTADRGASMTAYFGASDGLYSYNARTNKADKYGTITDSIISLAKVNGEDKIYILTENHVLYEVTNEGRSKQGVNNVVDAQAIVVDPENNLFFYTSDHTVYIHSPDGNSKIEGLPEGSSYMKIFKAPFVVENGIAVLANSLSYVVFANGSIGPGHCDYLAKPTAYSIEALLIQHYGYKNNIYELNFLSHLPSYFKGGLRRFLERRIGDISRIALTYKKYFQNHTIFNVYNSRGVKNKSEL